MSWRNHLLTGVWLFCSSVAWAEEPSSEDSSSEDASSEDSSSEDTSSEATLEKGAAEASEGSNEVEHTSGDAEELETVDISNEAAGEEGIASEDASAQPIPKEPQQPVRPLPPKANPKPYGVSITPVL